MLLGVLCLYALFEIITITPYVINNPVGSLPGLSLMLVFVLCIFNYVVNIGFSRDWHRIPVFVSLILLGLIALAGYLVTGNPSTRPLGIVLVAWVGYFYLHLGVSFVLAAILSTPGCEMRAIPELFEKVFKNEKAKEHHCPSSIITGVDKWESSHFSPESDQQ
jgi:uncharacterized membrane protein